MMNWIKYSNEAPQNIFVIGRDIANGDVYVGYFNDGYFHGTHIKYDMWCTLHDVRFEYRLIHTQPERSKREDSHNSNCVPIIRHDCWQTDCMIDGKCTQQNLNEMRCSEHGG